MNDNIDGDQILQQKTEKRQLQQFACGIYQDRSWGKLWGGLTLAIGAGFFGSCSSTVVKLASSLPFYEMMIARCFGIITFNLPLMIYYSNPFMPSSLKDLFCTLGRGVFGSAATILMFFAFEHVPLGDATALVFTSLVWSAILGYFFLDEKWTVYDSIALVLSLTGVILISRPSFILSNYTSKPEFRDEHPWYGYAAAIACSVFLSCSYVFVRKLEDNGKPFTIVFHYGVVGLFVAVGTGFAYKRFKLPDCNTLDNIYALLCGIFSCCGQVCVILALKFEKAAIVMLGRSTDIAFVFVLQVLFVHITANSLSIVGAALILFCNVCICIKKWNGY